MDTKLISNDSEKEKIEIKPKKKSNIIIGFILITAILISMITSIYSHRNYIYYAREYSVENEIRNDYDIIEATIRVAKNLNRYYIYYGGEKFETLSDEDKILPSDIENAGEELKAKLMQDEMAIEEEYFYRIRDSRYEVRIENFNSESDWVVKFDEEIIEKKNKELEELRESYNILFQNLAKEILVNKNENYANIKRFLKEESELVYSINNTLTGEIYSNLDKDIDYTKDVIFYDLNDPIFEYTFNNEYLSTSFKNNYLVGYIGVPLIYPLRESYQVLDPIEDRVKSILTATNYSGNYYTIFMFSIVILLILGTLVITIARSSFIEALTKIFKLYSYVPLLIKIPLAGFSLLYFYYEILYRRFDFLPYLLGDRRGAYYYYDPTYVVTRFALASAIMLCLFISILYCLYIIKDFRRIKQNLDIKILVIIFSCIKGFFKGSKNYVKNSKNIFENIGIVFKSKNLSMKIFLLLLFLIFILGSLFVLILTISYFESIIITLPLYALGLYILFFIGNLIISYCKIENYIQNLSTGELETVPLEKGRFSEPINNLNNISQGLKKNLDEMLKSEHLKYELITNVSHDLKTPLTSIISYVELLKKLNPQEHEKGKEYIAVLETKSQRLKILIDDLFEASKLTSGAVELNLEKIDIVAVLKQTLGELEEKIQNSSLTFRFNPSSEHFFLMLDGHKIWRVFENLITNILKYSQPNTRVFINVDEDENSIYITMKNTSAYEITFDADELFERFVRGDSARSTEGSGLGLSIAKNIIELHGGKLSVSVDGDLFKVTIVFNK